MRAEILYGYHPVREALRAGKRKLLDLYLSKGASTPRVEALASLASDAGIPVHRPAAEKIETLAGTAAHQGVCAAADPYVWAQLPPMTVIAAGHRPFLLLLDHIVDPHNLGALIRSAYCAGIDGVVITKDRSAGATPAVSKASAGALEHISLTRVTNMVSTLKVLKAAGIWVAGLDKHSGQSVFATDLTGPLALVVGGEEKGLRPLVKKHCDLLMAIPQIGEIDSLNASVAGGVVMYEAFRQREKDPMRRP